ncbi:MAG: CotH kinase family protein [Bacteroidales bacterium]|nr:CotH kinase family protein [Bacteroidales bacterium]
MELYDVDGNKQIDQDIGLKIFGSWSRALPQKSLAVFARNIYGKGSFQYKVFKDKPIKKFEALVLRNAGNDWSGAIMRDGLTSTLVRDMDMDRQAFQPAIIYINGEYWGIQNIREKVNSDYLAENHFVNPANVNLLEFSGSPVEGSGSSYNDIISYVETNTLETEQKYLQVSGKIDINNYIQYQLTEIYINNKDWPGNNIKFWNTNDQGSLWRWIIYDTDFGFSPWEDAAYTFNTMEFATDPDNTEWPNPSWSTLLFRRMLTNQNFRNNFINQYADRLNTNFKYEKVDATVDSIKQVFLPEINDHLLRWDLSYDGWEWNYSVIKNYARNRPVYARAHLKSKFSLGDLLDIRVEISSPGTGRVKINSIIPYSFPFSGIYFKDLPIKLTAIPSPGYKFVKWQVGTLNSDSVVLDYNMAAGATITAVFESAGVLDNKIVINEINYNSSPEKDTKDWIELYNAGNSSLNLKDWIISDAGPETGFVFPIDFILAPGTYIVVCRELAAFRQFWPNVLNSTGDMNFGLSSAGDNINLYDPDGNLVDFVSFSTSAPWPTDANGTGASIELVDPNLDNNVGSNWKSSANGGTPGVLNINTTTTDTTDNLPTSGCRLICYPNPFSDYTSIKIEVSVPGKYRIEIYNLQGKLVNILADQSIEEGVYYLDWGGTAFNHSLLPGGVYIIRLLGDKQHYNSKVIIIR